METEDSFLLSFVQYFTCFFNREIAELHRSNASQDSKAQEAALSAETHVREELKSAMEREQQRFRQEREAFIMQVFDKLVCRNNK